MHIVSVRIRFTCVRLDTIENSGLNKIEVYFPPIEIKSGGR